MPTAQEPQANPLLTFANVFKGYMGVMPIVTAVLAPLLTAMDVIPVYEPQRKPLATMAGVLGFLLLSWLFYVRRTIALGSITRGWRWLFNLCPLALIVGGIVCYVVYANTLDASLNTLLKAHPGVTGLTRAKALGDSSLDYAIPDSVKLQLLYLCMFLCAEAAFVMMALREYINGVRRISEFDWMFGAQDGSAPRMTLPEPAVQPAVPVASTVPHVAAPELPDIAVGR